MLGHRGLFTGVQHHWKTAGAYSTLGLEIVLSVLVGLWIGQWLEKKFPSGGWLTAVWFGFGVIAAARAVYRALRRANQEAAHKARENEEAHRKYFDESQDH